MALATDTCVIALPLMLAADRLFGRHLPAPRDRPRRRAAARGTVRPYSRVRSSSWTIDASSQRRRARPSAAPVSACAQDSRRRCMRARVRAQNLVGQPAQVLDERQRQHARPRPQLADRQRRDALVAVQERFELLADRTGCRCGGPARSPWRRRARARDARATASARQLPVVGPAAGCAGRRRSATLIRWKLSSSHSDADGDEPAGAHVAGQRLVGARPGRARCRRSAAGCCWRARAGSIVKRAASASARSSSRSAPRTSSRSGASGQTGERRHQLCWKRMPSATSTIRTQYLPLLAFRRSRAARLQRPRGAIRLRNA